MDSYSYLTIGGRDGGGDFFGNYFGGQLYGVRIYNTALTESQVNWFMPTNTGVLLPEFSAPPALSGNNFVLTWSGGSLQQATNVAGPWEDTGATSPYTNDVTTEPKLFFRLISN
jgi:hypothetical protein